MIYPVLFTLILLNSINAMEYFSNRQIIIRNMGLRFLLSCNYKKYKITFECLNNQFTQQFLQFQDNINLKIMEINNNYYSLSEDDRFLIENIMDLIL
jgi:hypothetical protein